MNEEYLGDKEIEELHSNWQVNEICWDTKTSGYIALEKGNISQIDNFILRSEGKLAFDYWYPEKEYFRLSKLVMEAKP